MPDGDSVWRKIMLIIRKEQMEIFEQTALRNFENDMIDHLKDFSPGHSRALGPDGVRKTVRLGIDRAATYGLTDRGPVMFYIEMMFMLGSYFDSDCQYPWAPRILTDETIEQQAERADTLFDQLMEFVDMAAGPGREYAIESLTKAGRLDFKELCHVQTGMKADLLSRLRHNYPQKCRFIGEAALNELVEKGRETAQNYSLENDAGIICFTWLMFTLGHGFDRDPLYPWCESILNSEDIDDPLKRAEKLYSVFRVYITKAIEHLTSNGR